MAVTFSNLTHVLGTNFRTLAMCPLLDLEEQPTDTGASKRDLGRTTRGYSSTPSVNIWGLSLRCAIIILRSGYSS